jgi:hypothetical protein
VHARSLGQTVQTHKIPSARGQAEGTFPAAVSWHKPHTRLGPRRHVLLAEEQTSQGQMQMHGY